MPKIDLDYYDPVPQLCQALQGEGALLVSVDKHGKPNAMTIGWATVGVIWGRPICIVLVRPSRYTFRCLNVTGDFTVNVPYPGQTDVCRICGSQSGRDIDKFAECGVTAQAGRETESPAIAECAVHYECKVVHKNNVAPVELEPGILGDYYPAEDFHTVYYGEIVACYADQDYAGKMG
jgi:flavin reductase (DIM6/NTAB) family NADH-FMN oxidoreductase RutF